MPCPPFWSSHKLALRGSCTSEPSHFGAMENDRSGGDAGRAAITARTLPGVRYFSELCRCTVL